MISFPADHFDIWFRYYLRRRGMSCARYAIYVGLDQRIIEGVANGSLYPPAKVLQEMGVTIERQTAEKCRWDFQRVINEI